MNDFPDEVLSLTIPAMAKYGNRCVYCERDHGLEVHPIWPGEPIDLENVIVCCVWCNADRGAKSHGEYLNEDVAKILGFDGEAGL